MQNPGPNIQTDAQSLTSNEENPRRFKDQNYDSLKEIQITKRQLFEDETFPADIGSLGLNLAKELNIANVEWKRPMAKCKDPQFIVDGASFFDIAQSKIGNCWVLATIGSVTLKQRLLRKIIPSDQGYSKNYMGIFHFRFWCSGEWVDVVIDDQLPFVNGEFFSVRPTCAREYWPCLLEKAYAKLLGSYENLHWGDPAEALVNFTGALTMTFRLKDGDLNESDLWEMVLRSSDKVLITCISEKADVIASNRRSSVPVPNEYLDMRRGSMPVIGSIRDPLLVQKIQENIRVSNGLVDRHAYSVTDATQVRFRNSSVNLIRLWNPWGRGEWVGRWGDNCPWWKEINVEDRQRLHVKGDDGEFWISWEDFVQQFSAIIICNPTPDFLDWGNEGNSWYKTTYQNVWQKETSYKDSFYKNPQYLIRIKGSDEVKKGYNIVLSLMQNHKNKQKFGGDWLPINFLLSKVDAKLPDPKQKMAASFFPKELLSEIRTKRQRDVTKGFKVTSGRYILTPFTTNQVQESSFLLQVFLKSKDCIEELGVSTQIKEVAEPEKIFMQFATQGNGMNVWDLQRFLNEEMVKGFSPGGGTKFSLDASRTVLSSMDFNLNGTLDFGTFRLLWKYLEQFKRIFMEIDVNQCGYIDQSELRKAAMAAGINVANSHLSCVALRYGDSEKKFNFQDYLCCMMRLKSGLKKFEMLTQDGKGVYLEQEKWLQILMAI